ncbi:MAG: AMP-binding protein, partial [Anaerolineales bacterium]|nr:AMP-binding protein [Anaerolineales bacterium]
MQIKNLKVTTLPDMLRSAADRQPEKGFAFEENDGVTFLTYPQILREAEAWAARWQTLGLQPGDCVLVIMATAPLFAPVYWSLLLCGAIPCVLPSPTLIQGKALGVEKLRQVGLRLQARWLVTSEHEIGIWGENTFPFPLKSIEEVASLSPASFTPPDIHSEDIALIQASSGSTSQPKCIALTHLNVLANLHQSEDRLQASPNDVTVSWLPLFHDMGLIGCFLFVTYCQMKGVLIPPANFIRRPVRWLQAFTDHKGSLSPAPNFAYALALRRVSAAEQASLDLSSWRSAMCGAEPIDARVLQAFARRFQRSGFDPAALTPCYGLAEAALCVTMKEMKRPLAVETICRETAATEQIAKVVPSNQNGQETLATLDICDCGPPVMEAIIEIRDEHGRV